MRLDSGSRDSPIEPVLVKSAPPRAVAGDRFARQPRRRRGFWLVALIVMVIPLGILLREDLGRHGSAARAKWGGIRTRRKLRSPPWLSRGLGMCAGAGGDYGRAEGWARVFASGDCRGCRWRIAATLVTWRAAARLLDDIGTHSLALALQAGTGLLAIIVLLVVMNWFLHRLYWTGDSLHQRKKQSCFALRKVDVAGGESAGNGSLGFTSFYGRL